MEKRTGMAPKERNLEMIILHSFKEEKSQIEDQQLNDSSCS